MTMTSQWDRLLENAGTWVGSFTQLSSLGAVIADTPSVVALIPQDDGKAMRQEIHKQPPGQPPTERVLEYASLNRSILFFEGGAFSQGSIQWGPFSEFGAELGLIAEPHRLRLVQLFNRDRQLQITLIREHRQGTDPSQRPPLTVAQLVGTWRGEAVTLYADLSPCDRTATELTLVQEGQHLHQTLHFGDGPPFTSTGTIEGDRIVFTGGPQTLQVLLLPDGASATCPIAIEPRQPLFLEVGWLITPHLRQRMIRRYNAQGAWVSLTLVTEQKVAVDGG
ncbi:DUF3598 family protein [Leptolyngbya sp. PCC 6406]|uniref:DUF3598 family protein n=1 Tax=Leptolyngbya sp. PCC 6406 TaxID=1173264 RepID=UPI0021F1FAB3|nr:DUF3598 family protein [Leptolyngbya sp. PCC 6406]